MHHAAILLLAPVLSSAFAGVAHAQPDVQIAILLDGSMSMRGFTETARSKVVRAVQAKAVGRAEVALYVFGKKGSPATRITPFTESVDEVLQKIQEEYTDETLTGGQEGPGLVMTRAEDNLTWDPEARVRLMIVVGNESFDQTPRQNAGGQFRSSPRGTSVAANLRNHTERVRIMGEIVDVPAPITLDVIFCGPKPEANRDKWEKATENGLGEFDYIDPAAIP